MQLSTLFLRAWPSFGRLRVRHGFALSLALLAAGSVADPGGGARPAPFVLTPDQVRWLADHPQIRLASDPQWPPFSFDDGSGRVVGLDVDLTRMVERQLGRRFQRVAVADWSEAYRMGKAREIDVLSGMSRSVAREQYFLFTSAYFTQSFGIVTRMDAPFLATLGQLGGHRIAVVSDHAVTERLRSELPSATLVAAATTAEALQLVSSGAADAMLTDLANASYIIKTAGLANLKIAGIADFHFELRFAVRRDWPELVGILDAVIAARDPADEQAMIDRWVRVDYADVARWGSVWRVLTLATGAVLLVVTAVFWHNSRLRRELAERRRVEVQLRGARDHLEELNKEKTHLLHMAAHDLRNPLTGMLLSLDLLEAGDPGERRRLLDDTRHLTRHMVQLINNLLDSQTLEDGRRILRPEVLDWAELVREAVAENQPMAARKCIALILTTLGQCPVCADPGALRQVVDNLLSNAIKFSPKGARVWVDVRPGQGVCRLQVRDEGPGISTGGMKQLFTKYARLNARPTGGESSVGLGLSIVRQLVEALSGRLWCESELGRGAAFIVEFASATDAAEIGGCALEPGGADGRMQAAV